MSRIRYGSVGCLGAVLAAIVGVWAVGTAGMVGLSGYGTTGPSAQDSKIMNSLGVGGLLLLATALMTAAVPRRLRAKTLASGSTLAVVAAAVLPLLSG